jgi:hypothetical protein
MIFNKSKMPSITFEFIDNQYEWGYYSDFKVLIMTRNRYINATKLCQDGDRRFRNWLNNDYAINLINELESSAINLADGKSMIRITGGNDFEVRGTYVHLDLIPSIAGWISPAFALKVNRIVNEYLLKEEKIKHATIIKEKDNEIDELKGMVKAILKNTNNLDTKVTDLTDEISKLSLDNQITHDKLDDSQITLNDIQNNLDNVQNTLDIVVEDRVVKTDDEGFKNTISIYESIDQGPNKFYIFRVQKRGLKAALKRYLTKNPNAVKFDEIEYNPNAVNYYTRFKQEYKKDIKSFYNSFELLNITKDQLKEFIDEINNEKYQIENCK